MLKITRALLCFLFPTWMVRPLLNVLGWEISLAVKVGFSIILTENVRLATGVRIGSLNVFNSESIICDNNSTIGHGNRCKGKVNIILRKEAALGNFNIIVKASEMVKKGETQLHIGEKSKITSRHYIDCICDVVLQNGVVIGGCGSQIWTHGYYHYPDRHERFRVDGAVEIGNYCYIGSQSVISPGVKLCQGVSVGGHSSIAKSIDLPGLYVSQPLRRIEKTPEQTIQDLTQGDSSIENYYVKKN